jgi:gamma-glutamyltranspeptidase/glutathione hydrolase
MIASSHLLATQAGMRAFDQGGNAADAALAAAAVATVVEPNTNGPGGDMFAIVWNDGRLEGLNGSGRSPAALDRLTVDAVGPRSVTVPGAVRAWADLAERYGRFGLDRALRSAADLARAGVSCSARIAEIWAATEHPPWRAPKVGETYRLPELAETLARIADEGPDAFYTGDLARAIASCTWLDEEDLAGHRSEWVEPLRGMYRGHEICELPPNGQGAAALLALALLEGFDPSVHLEIEAMKWALADAYAHLGDGPLPEAFLDPRTIASRRRLIRTDRAGEPRPAILPRGGTTYLCAVDDHGMAVSLIQSLYMSFGSGVVVPGSGVVLQNRGACFVEDQAHPNAIAPSKRPFHTIMPGLLLKDGELLGPFGLVGGAMQPQGHLQFVHHIVDEGRDPQAALDAPRWRLDEKWQVELEPGLEDAAADLRRLGHVVRVASSRHPFGVGQAILRTPTGALIGGSDGRADGYAAGW